MESRISIRSILNPCPVERSLCVGLFRKIPCRTPHNCHFSYYNDNILPHNAKPLKANRIPCLWPYYISLRNPLHIIFPYILFWFIHKQYRFLHHKSVSLLPQSDIAKSLIIIRSEKLILIKRVIMLVAHLTNKLINWMNF